MNKLEEIKAICDGIKYTRNVPFEAKQIAKQNGIIIIVGGSDYLMYCYGAECFLTNHAEHSYGWEGDTLKDIEDDELEKEADQLGLMIWWCGEIEQDGLKIEGYNTEESGVFSYSVKEGIQALDFKVVEDGDIYCTGKIIKLPDGFNNSLPPKQETEVRREIISMMDEYFGDGCKDHFFKSDTYSSIVDNAVVLVFTHDLGSIEALDIVSNVYNAGANEYGS